MLQNPFENLGDGALEQSLIELARGERNVNADIILHLVLVKERKLYVAAGFESLFAYCCGKLGFSKSAAFRRKVVAEKAAEFPAVIERLRDGRLQLCAAAAIVGDLSAGTAEELLDAVVGMSHREVEAFLVKQWRVKAVPVAEAIVRKSSNVGTALVFDAPAAPDRIAPKSVQKTVVKPVSQFANRVSVTLSDKTLANLKRAKEILGQQTDDEVLCKALERLLDQIAPERRHERREKRKTRVAAPSKSGRATGAIDTTRAAAGAAVAAPRAPKALRRAAEPRRAKAAVRDQVAVAAGNQCSFVASDGRRCGARTYIEIDHIKPWALGGSSSADNQRPLCRAHNVYYAEKSFGPWRKVCPRNGVVSPGH